MISPPLCAGRPPPFSSSNRASVASRALRCCSPGTLAGAGLPKVCCRGGGGGGGAGREAFTAVAVGASGCGRGSMESLNVIVCSQLLRADPNPVALEAPPLARSLVTGGSGTLKRLHNRGSGAHSSLLRVNFPNKPAAAAAASSETGAGASVGAGATPVGTVALKDTPPERIMPAGGIATCISEEVKRSEMTACFGLLKKTAT
mmetsp:Transcript_319/g.963  ORF Transcript_319/g.963 Transcript_319/m.963 type:complete len:203 (-) Transcript_319:2033-2641(-)|eukprot:scaffold12948_cov23-Tisochrysis_lutea.AAC.3